MRKLIVCNVIVIEINSLLLVLLSPVLLSPRSNRLQPTATDCHRLQPQEETPIGLFDDQGLG